MAESPGRAAALEAVKDEERRLLELDADLGGLLLEALARAQIDRHAGPAPVFDLQTESGVSLSAGVGIDPLLLAITDHALAVDHARAILAAHGVEDRDGGHRLPDFELFLAHALGLKA